jgi:hypothetical protein
MPSSVRPIYHLTIRHPFYLSSVPYLICPVSHPPTYHLVHLSSDPCVICSHVIPSGLSSIPFHCHQFHICTTSDPYPYIISFKCHHSICDTFHILRLSIPHPHVIRSVSPLNPFFVSRYCVFNTLVVYDLSSFSGLWVIDHPKVLFQNPRFACHPFQICMSSITSLYAFQNHIHSASTIHPSPPYVISASDFVIKFVLIFL